MHVSVFANELEEQAISGEESLLAVGTQLSDIDEHAEYLVAE